MKLVKLVFKGAKKFWFLLTCFPKNSILKYFILFVFYVTYASQHSKGKYCTLHSPNSSISAQYKDQPFQLVNKTLNNLKLSDRNNMNVQLEFQCGQITCNMVFLHLSYWYLSKGWQRKQSSSLLTS